MNNARHSDSMAAGVARPANIRPLVAGTAAICLVAVGAFVAQVAAAAEPPVPSALGAIAPAAALVPSSFPPKSNGAWIYDGAARGQWLPVITAYNQIATAEHRLSQINTYGSDIELDGTDYLTYYDTSAKTGNRDTTSTYYNALQLAPSLSGTAQFYTFSPIIDAQLSSGYVDGFNITSQATAEKAADGVARQICADERVDGIQFDIEPFDVTKNGQFWFYNQISKNFAGLHSGSTATDPYGCVNAKHPTGRYYSVFAFAQSLNPANGTSASRVADVFNTSGVRNGYFVDSLYDLGTRPTGYLNDLPTYHQLVTTEVTDMKRWANAAGIYYGFGIPASASAHEWEICTGGCVAGADGSTGHPMIEYTKRAVDAINAAGSPSDPLYIGANIWSLGSFTAIDPFNFYPSPAPADVLTWLAANLPGSKVAGPAPTTSPTPTPAPTTTPTPTTSPTPPTSNLLTNPGFENGGAGWSCDGSTAVDTTTSSAGSASVKLTPTATTTAVCAQTLTVRPRTVYTLSAKLKSSGAVVTVGARNYSEASSSAAAFTTKSLTITPTGTSLTVYVQAYKQQTGNGWADEVVLTAP